MDAGAMVTGGRAGKVAGRGRAADGRATQTLGLPDPSSLELSTHLRSSVLTPHSFASPMQKAFHPLGGAHFHTQVGPKQEISCLPFTLVQLPSKGASVHLAQQE